MAGLVAEAMVSLATTASSVARELAVTTDSPVPAVAISYESPTTSIVNDSNDTSTSALSSPSLLLMIFFLGLPAVIVSFMILIYTVAAMGMLLEHVINPL